MYHRGHSNLHIYDEYSNMNRVTPHKRYPNVSLSPHPIHKSIPSQSPTLSYELPYALQPPPSALKNKSETPKNLRFMSKITEEIVVSPSPSPSPTPCIATTKPSKPPKPQKPQKHPNGTDRQRKCATNNIQRARHFSDGIEYESNHRRNPIKPKMINSTSNRSYRKYKTRNDATEAKRIKRRKHRKSDHELMQQNKHRNTEKKTHKKHSSKDNKTRRKHRAQSTVLYSESNHNYSLPSHTANFKVLINDDEYPYYNDIERSKKSSQDSYAQTIKTKNMDNRPQTARPQRKKHKTKNTEHYKSQSHGQSTNHRRKPTKKRSKMDRTNRHYFNEGAMDYMSAEQQLLYLYDYTSAAVRNRSSASLTTNDSSTNTTNTLTVTPNTISRRDNISLSLSNRRNGVNSDAITPRSELHTASSPIATSYPLHVQRHRDILSPPISKYSELSTRAVRYSPAAHPQRYHDAYIRDHDHDRCTRDNDTYMVTPEPSLPNLPSPRYTFKTRSNSELALFPITPYERNREQTMVIHHDTIDTHDIQDPALLEIPASLTAEESGACYLEGLEGETMRHTGDDHDHGHMLPTIPLMYRLFINDKEWHDIPTPSNTIHQQLLRRSKLQCTV